MKQLETVGWLYTHVQSGDQELSTDEDYKDAADIERDYWNKQEVVLKSAAIAAIEAQSVPAGLRKDLQKVRDSLDADDWCGDERMVDVLDRVLGVPCCVNYSAGTNCFADPKTNCPMLASAPPAPQASEVQQEPVAYCALNGFGNIAFFDGKPMVMPGRCGNEHHPVALYTHPAPQASLAQPAQMSQPNRLIAYSAANKLRELGYAWNEKSESWEPPSTTGKAAAAQ